MDDPIHITPEDDLFEHDLSRNCPCNPRVESGGKYYADVIVHNAYDARDIVEDYQSLGETIQVIVIYE